MSVVILACRQPAAAAQCRPRPGFTVRSVCADRDASLIARLGDDLAGADEAGGRAGPVPAGGGLLAEFASRPGRMVEAWIATRPESGAGRPRIAGVVSLVTCLRPTGPRHSIGWLLVHPADRRQGVGRMLVAHACRRALEAGAQTVWAESRGDWAEAITFWHAVGFSART